MYFLSFETSSKIFSLALSHDDKVLRFRNLKSALVLEDSMIPAINKMLDAAGVKFNELDGFAIAVGPGSFTSLRVGLATVKAFALATDQPVVGIPTMDIIAQGVSVNKPCDYDQICVVSDARREKVYACLYGEKGRLTEYLLTSLDDLLERVHGKTLFVGEGLELYQDKIVAAYKKYASTNKNACQCLFADKKYWHPNAKDMASLAYQRFKHQQYDDAATLQPLYLYPQDCQVSTAHGR